ncbi:hypothetical protein M2142_001756 [Fusobacterium sp. PH5-29]|uniref:hypothetical protein n=1 Tax=Fusobacterium sp. PH5-29 TaxID=1742400 RepID=UPI003D2004CC
MVGRKKWRSTTVGNTLTNIGAIIGGLNAELPLMCERKRRAYARDSSKLSRNRFW